MSEFFKKNGGKKDKAVASCSTETADEIDERGQAYDIPPPDPNFGDERAGGPNRNRLRYYCNRRSGLTRVPVMRLYQRSRLARSNSRRHMSRLDPFDCVPDPEGEEESNSGHHMPRPDPFDCVPDPEGEKETEFVGLAKPCEQVEKTRGIKRFRFRAEGRMATAGGMAAGRGMAAVRSMVAEGGTDAETGAMVAEGATAAAGVVGEAAESTATELGIAAAGELVAKEATGAGTGAMVADDWALVAGASATAAGYQMAAAEATAFLKKNEAMDRENLCSAFDEYFEIKD